jgi:RNA-binding protein
MRLDGYQRRHLRGLAHHLKPVVQVGKAGLSPTVLAAVDEAFETHELIKVRLAGDKAEKKEMISALEDHTRCAEVGLVGHVATLYREHREPAERKIKLPARGDPAS